MSTGRRLALALLEEVERGRRLDLAWASRSGGLPHRERAWLHELAFGTIRLRGRLDHLLDRHLHEGIASVGRPLLSLLRLGAYQLLYMGSVPGYAAVSETASQASGIGGRRWAGLVNAVLRALAREGADPAGFPDFEGIRRGTVDVGLPPPVARRALGPALRPGAAREIVEAGNRIPELFLRPVGASAEEASRAARLRGGPGLGGSRTPGDDPAPPGVELPRILDAAPGDHPGPGGSSSGGFPPRRRGGARRGSLCSARR